MKTSNSKQQVFCFFGLLLMTLLLAGCYGQQINPAKYKYLLNHSHALKKVHFLCEYREFRPWGISGVYLAEPGGYCGHGPRLPELAVYEQNSQYWQSWQQRLGAKYRILGVSWANTLFKIDRLVLPSKMSDQNSYADITIVSGKFAGRHVKYPYINPNAI